MILKSDTYHFHRLDLTRQAGFIVTVNDEDGLRLAATMPTSTPPKRSEKREKLSITKSRDRTVHGKCLAPTSRGYGGNQYQAASV